MSVSRLTFACVLQRRCVSSSTPPRYSPSAAGCSPKPIPPGVPSPKPIPPGVLFSEPIPAAGCYTESSPSPMAAPRQPRQPLSPRAQQRDRFQVPVSSWVNLVYIGVYICTYTHTHIIRGLSFAHRDSLCPHGHNSAPSFRC